jgi:hypothetical protein
MSVLMRRWAAAAVPGLVTKALAEFTGCMIFHFIGSFDRHHVDTVTAECTWITPEP